MTQPGKQYVSLSVTSEARDVLRQMQLTMSAVCLRQLTMSEVILIADRVTDVPGRDIRKGAERAGVIDSHTTTSAR